MAEEHERVESPSLEDEYASREESDAAEEDVLVAAHLGATGAHLVEADGGEHDARAEDGGGAEVDVDEGADAHGTRAGGDARAAAGVLAEEGGARGGVAGKGDRGGARSRRGGEDVALGQTARGDARGWGHAARAATRVWIPRADDAVHEGRSAAAGEVGARNARGARARVSDAAGVAGDACIVDRLALGARGGGARPGMRRRTKIDPRRIGSRDFQE